MMGFLPGEAGARSVPGCCRYNEMIYADVFKFAAVCSILYAIHAFWLVKLFRSMFPRGYAKTAQMLEPEQWEGYKRDVHVLATDIMPPAEAPSGYGTPLVT